MTKLKAWVLLEQLVTGLHVAGITYSKDFAMEWESENARRSARQVEVMGANKNADLRPGEQRST